MDDRLKPDARGTDWVRIVIVAMPKSASTSLMATLGRLRGKTTQQRLQMTGPVPAGFEALGGFHSDVREWSLSQIRDITEGGGVFKQHIPPTAEHLAMLRRTPKVILLRNVNDIPGAYCRAAQKGHTTPPPDFAGCESENDWFIRACTTGLLDELRDFREGWLAEAEHVPDTCHVVRYADLMLDPQRAINSIERFYKLSESAEVVLARKRFTGRKTQ